MEIGLVRHVDINAEVERAYLDYAMSVIVARALPDARDGLKPVQRRILYAMYDMGLRADSAYRKSARIVGEVLGKYHPHGDVAVYEAMARMAQDFSLRQLLVDGQGNFGSVDGDSPAAMRYTEARLSPVALELLTDIEKETVDWGDNFDGSLKEPLVLPARLPNLLINGASGIAVGMSTNIPPHNLGEVVDALAYMLDHWERVEEMEITDLLRFIQGPDFPTGGLAYRKDEEDGEDTLLKAYATGRGHITLRARAHVEESARGRQRLVITEIPYQVNKSSLIEGIAKSVREGRLEGIADLRDESDRQGMRIVIDLVLGADPNVVLAGLYRRTPLESRYSIILLALVDGEPRRLSLKRALHLFLEHRLELLVRRTQFELTQAQRRAHILEGLLIALEHLDEVIDTIRRSRTTETAAENLRKKFKLSEAQAHAVLEMPLRRLAALERQKIKEEHAQLKALIEELEALLAAPEKQRGVIRADLLALKSRYADPRRTHMIEVKGQQVIAEALTPDEAMWVSVSALGRVARCADEGKTPPRANAHPAEPPLALLSASTRDTLYLFSKTGDAVALPVHQIPEGVAWDGGGVLWSALTHVENGREFVGALALPSDPPPGTLCFITAQGQVKRMTAAELPGVGREFAPVIRLDEGDALVDLAWVTEADEVLLGSASGQGVRFAVAEVRPTGARAGGMSGMRLAEGDRVVGMAVVQPGAALLTLTGLGAAKRSSFDDFPTQRRSGKGVQIAKLGVEEALVGVGALSDAGRCIPVTESGGAKTLLAHNVPERGRAARGETVIALQSRDRVARVVFLTERVLLAPATAPGD